MRLTRGEHGTKVLAPNEVQGTSMPVTKVTSELPSVEDTIDAEAQSVPGTISPTCRSGVGALVAWQDAVQKILIARPAFAQALRESSASSCF